MGKKVKVQLFGQQNRYVEIDLEASRGATLGKNLYDENGKVLSKSDLVTTSSTVVNDVPVTVSLTPSVTVWSLISGIPAFIQSLAALATAGLVVRSNSSGGTALVRTLQGTVGRITVTDGDGVAGDPTFDLGNWPTVKNSVGTGETATIPAGQQLLCADEFVIDGGTLNLEGTLVII